MHGSGYSIVMVLMRELNDQKYVGFLVRKLNLTFSQLFDNNNIFKF